MKNKSSKIGLSIGFGTILILLVIMTTNWLIYIGDTNKRVETILKEQKATSLVFKMRDSAHQRTLILHRIALLDDTFDRDEEYMIFKQLASDFIKARDELFSMGIYGAEEKTWKKARELIYNGGQIQQSTIEYFLEDRDSIAKKLLLNDVTETQKNVMRELTKMLNIQRSIMNMAAKRTVSSNKETYNIVLYLGIAIILLGSGIAILTIIISIKNQRELIKTQQDAESASHYKSLFLANMSHEIRTPLTAVIGYAETLLNPNLAHTDRQNYTNTIIRNGKHLLQVINEILDLSKIEANKLEIEIIEISFLDVVEEVTSVMGKIAREKGLEFKTNYNLPIPIIIKSDPTRLKQILLNITSNAIKFTEQGCVTIACAFEKSNGIITFTVNDTGIGVDEDAIQHIFKSFSQADASTTRKYGGTGLGLTISKQLANMLGGDLECVSKAGEGTQFTLTIDPGEINDDVLLNYLPEGWSMGSGNQQITAPHVKGEVLLAEDSPDIQGLVSLYVQRTGANVTTVENGKMAIEKAIACDFDLILMDMQMPIMDGLQATKWLRSTGYDGKIVALTANAMKEDRQKYSDAGVDDFLAKPIDLAQFYSVMRKYLEEDNSDDITTMTNENNKMEDSEIDKIEDLVLKFESSLPDRMRIFSQAIENLDLQILRSEAHKLKGVASSFGFPEITNVAGKIEQMAKDQEFHQASELFVDLDEMCKKIALRKG